MLHDPITIATACFAVILLGLAKGGFSAVGAKLAWDGFAV